MFGSAVSLSVYNAHGNRISDVKCMLLFERMTCFYVKESKEQKNNTKLYEI